MSCSLETPTNKTRDVAAYLANLEATQAPAHIAQQAKLLLLDTLGCIAGASRTQAYQPIIRISQLFGGAQACTLAGAPANHGLLQSIYGNARLANLMDMDETFPVGVHFGAATVATAVAAAESGSCTGYDLLNGLIAGYELGGRIATAIGPMMHIANGEVTGFAPVWGVAAPVVMASTAAYGRLKRLSTDKFQQALGISGSNIPLPIGRKWSDAVDLPDVKYCDSGWCAVAGVHGVEAALAGTSGFNDILDGPVGIPEAYGAVMAAPEYIWSELGQHWHLADLTYKPWPTCRFMHPAMSALARILRTNRLLPEQIESIIIHTGPLANSRRFRNPQPASLASHQFSYAHAVSMMVLGITPGPDWFDPAIAQSEAALAVRDKVHIELGNNTQSFAQTMHHNQMRTMPGGATVHTTQNIHEEHCEYADGDPWDSEYSYSESDVIAKFHAVVDHPTSQDIVPWIMNLEKAKDVAPLTLFLRHIRTQ